MPRMAQSMFAAFWLAGNSTNDTTVDGLLFREAHKECAFEEGEFVWMECKSFPLLAHLWGGKALAALGTAHGLFQKIKTTEATRQG